MSFKAATSVDQTQVRSTRNEPTHVGELEAAGWSNRWRVEVFGAFETLRWSNLRTLACARDEVIIRRRTTNDVVGAMRDAWVGNKGNGTIKSFHTHVADAPAAGAATRVLLIGDTGDGSQAQRAVALQLAGRAVRPSRQFQTSDCAALLIESDIVYPAGAADEYPRKFFNVYRELATQRVPIYAVPGNHDWNDGSLWGFMSAFCGADRTQLGAVRAAREQAISDPLARKFWHLGPRRHGLKPLTWRPPNGRPLRYPPAPAAPQKGPYVDLFIGGVLFIGVDTGYGDTIDHMQARWLVETFEDPKWRATPKILFTGRPLIVKGERTPCLFDPRRSSGPRSDSSIANGHGGAPYRSVDDVVREPRNGCVAAIGGDVHNYQRYLAHITRQDGTAQTLPYIVEGGGGVFIGQTYWLPRINIDDKDEAPVDQETGLKAEGVYSDDHINCVEEETVLFPTRPHSWLYWGYLVSQSGHRVRFMYPVAQLAAAAAALLVSLLGLLHHLGALAFLPTLSGWASLALLSSAIAINTSARPVSWMYGRVWSLGFAALSAVIASAGGSAGSVLSWPAIQRPLRIGALELSVSEARWAVAAGLFGGVALLQVAEASWFGRGTARTVGQVISFVCALILAAASLVLIGCSFGPTDNIWWVISAYALIVVIAVALIWLVIRPGRKVSVDEAFQIAEQQMEQPGDLTARDLRQIERGRKLADHAKSFSIYETFNDGRLWNRAHGMPVGSVERPYVPLYRSLLEIEFRRDEQDAFEFVFTAYAVSGEATVDSHTGRALADGATAEVALSATLPEDMAEAAVIDAFRVLWTPPEGPNDAPTREVMIP